MPRKKSTIKVPQEVLDADLRTLMDGALSFYESSGMGFGGANDIGKFEKICEAIDRVRSVLPVHKRQKIEDSAIAAMPKLGFDAEEPDLSKDQWKALILPIRLATTDIVAGNKISARNLALAYESNDGPLRYLFSADKQDKSWYRVPVQEKGKRQ